MHLSLFPPCVQPPPKSTLGFACVLLQPLTRRQRRRVQKMHLLPEVQAYMTGSYYGKSAAELLFQMAIQAARDCMENLWCVL